MTTVPKRLGVKFSLKQTPQLQPADILPIFQRWIQEHTVPGLLIDVIDYKHVLKGPGVVLVADEADYAYDLGEGQPGLHYVRKRGLPGTLSAAIRLSFHNALQAARALEAEAPGDLVFDFTSAKISFLDRMTYRNRPEVYDAVRAEVAEIVGEIYGAPVELTRVNDDPRRLFALRARVKTRDVDLDDMAYRLSDSRETA
jgi:hypothetical protein